MKKKIILLFLFALATFSGWAQSISYTSVPTSTQVGTNLVLNYQYTAPTAGGKVAVFISKNGGVNPWDYISAVIYAESTSTVAGTDVTGTFTLAIPVGTTPTASLTGNQNYRIKIELFDASNNWLAGDYSVENYNFTAPAVAVPAISITSIPTSTQVGTNLVVDYKYTALSAGGKVAILVSKNGGANPWDYISTVYYDELTPTITGTDVTGTFTLAIPAETTPTASLTGNENYKIQIELLNSSNTWLAGNYDNTNYNFTAAPVTPAISFTSVPTSTEVGTNLAVNYKYTAPSAGGKVAIVVTKNGGVNPWDYISTVVYDELTPTVAGTDVTGTFTLAIPAETTPTSGLTGNENYSMKIELLDSSNNWLAGNYDYTNYNFTAVPLTPAISFTSVPSSTQVGTNFVANYKYTAPAAGGKVVINISKNGGANPWDYISNVYYDELTPTVAGTDVTGTFTLAIPAETTPTASLTGNENYRIKIELLDSSSNFLTGNYDYINYNFTAATYNYYVDADMDNFGKGPVVSLTSSTAPSGYSLNDDDCDDTNATVYPGATEIFDIIDNDCDGSVDEGATLPSSLSFCKGATVAFAKGTTDLQLYTSTSLTAVALTGTTALSSKVYYATLNGSARTALTITVNNLPSTPASMTTTDAVLCKHIGTTNAVTYSVPFVVGIEEYSWTLPAGVTASSAIDTNAITVNFENASPSIAVGGIGTISARAISAQGCSSAPRSLVLTSKLPTAPTSLTMTSADTAAHFRGIITAADPLAVPPTKAIYGLVGLNTLTTGIKKVGPYMATPTVFILKAPIAPTAASYQWTLPSGTTQLSGTTSNEITVDFAGVPAGIGSLPISVKSVGGCGLSTARTLTLGRTVPGAPTALILTNSSQSNLSSLTKITKVGPYTGTSTSFTLTATPFTTQGATSTSYAWILPSGVNCTSEYTSTTVSVTSKVLNPTTLILEPVAENVPAISTTSNVISLNFNGATGSGNLELKVFGLNRAGNSVARKLVLARALPTAPTALVLKDGGTVVTKVGAYIGNTTSLTLTATPFLTQGAEATSFTWTLPSGVNVTAGATLVSNNVTTKTWTSTGTVLTIDFDSVDQGVLSLQLSIQAVNGAGTSATTRTLPVTSAAPTSPAITAVGGTTFNNCNSKTYSVVQTLGTSYTWSVPAGASFVQTGNTIVVDYSGVEALVGATVQVTCTASNGTGSSLAKVLNVKRVICPIRLSGSSANAFSAKAYPNPSSSEFTIETSAKGAISVKVYDMQGRLVEKANTDKVGSRLAKGVYNVIVNQGANSKSVRVIKK